VRYGTLFYGMVTIGSIAPIFFFQPFLREHGFDVGELGFWQTPMRFTGILGALFAHWLIAQAGERRLFYAMPITMVTSFLILAAWDSPGAQVAFLTMNFVFVLSQPLVTDYLNKRVESEERATVLSLTNLVRSAILIPTAPLLGQLAEESLRSAFLVGGVIVAAIALPLMIAFSPHLARAERAERRAAEPVGITGGK
jgi:MFS family permease